jgi:hypothetical protein
MSKEMVSTLFSNCIFSQYTLLPQTKSRIHITSLFNSPNQTLYPSHHYSLTTNLTKTNLSPCFHSSEPINIVKTNNKPPTRQYLLPPAIHRQSNTKSLLPFAPPEITYAVISSLYTNTGRVILITQERFLKFSHD